MPVATANKDRQIPMGGIPQLRRLSAEINANPFVGSAISPAADGHSHELLTGEAFQGFAREQIRTAEVATADGERKLEVDAGFFLANLPLTGVAQDDVAHRRVVYASDDNTFNMIGSGSPVGVVVGVAGTDLGTVMCRTADLQPNGGPFNGFETLADAGATLTTSQLDKVLSITPTAGRTLVLPIAADCTGRCFIIVTLGAFAITADGSGAETVNGTATFAGGATVGSVLRLISTGTAWVSC